MLQGSLFAKYACLRCKTPARLHKFYRLCQTCCKHCQETPKERFWLLGDRDVDEDAPTQAPPGSAEKRRFMRQRLLDGLSLFNEADAKKIDWAQTDLAVLFSEPQQRQAGCTGVERDGTRFRARPMAGGVKHDLGEFATEAEALGLVEWFWLGWLCLPPDATQEQVEEERAKDASGAREGARERRRRLKKKIASEEDTPLFGPALQYQ